MVTTQTHSATRSDQLLDVLAAYDEFMIVMHDNPDPDAIASGWALECLIEEKLGRTARLIGGGAIVRAENRHMVDLLGPPIQLVLNIDADVDAAALLVDCGIGAGNQLLTRSAIHPVAVIDHHANGPEDGSIPFVDIRPDVAASASLTTTYLREQSVDPGPKLATALLYAIRTESRGSETRCTALDHACLVWLTERADPELLAAIENAPLSRDWYGDLVHAMRSTIVYGDTAICFLPSAEGAEIVGEVADLLVRGRGLRRVLCAAVVHEDLLISARTEPTAGNATHLLQQTLEGIGGCGGHPCRAGGKVSGAARQGRIDLDLASQIRQRWLAACGADADQATPLVSPI